MNLPKVSKGNTVSLVFKINNIPKGETVTLEIKDSNEGTAESGTDYDITTTSLIKKIDYNGPNILQLDLKVMTAKEKTIVLNVSSTGSKQNTYKITVNLNSSADFISLAKPAKSDALVVPDTTRWKVRIVTGGNFDFFNGPKIKDFAGELTVSLPNIFAVKGAEDNPIGVQFGLFNFHYYQSDSSGTFKNQDYYYLHSQDAFKSYDSTKRRRPPHKRY